MAVAVDYDEFRVATNIVAIHAELVNLLCITEVLL